MGKFNTIKRCALYQLRAYFTREKSNKIVI